MTEGIWFWKRQARNYQQSCCNSLADRLYDRVNGNELALKVGYALYNAPAEVDKENKTAVYTKAQQKHITLVCNKIKSLQISEIEEFYISYIYVVIQLRNKNKGDGIQVLFRVPKFTDGKPNLESHSFVDPKPRVYETWGDYLKNNKLPKCEMCYPVNGIYTVTDGIVDLHFGCSPACDTSNAVFKGLDISSTVLLVGATGVTLASLAIPIATPVIVGATATVFASGTYETARSVYRLHDIKKHKESLTLENPDSRSAWLSLAGSMVGMASIGTTAIAKGVVATESAFSRAGIMTLRVLNVSSLAISGLGVVNGIVSLVMKKINGTLETEDIIQFTFTCLFFANAVVSYKMASALIEELASSDLSNAFNVRENTTYRLTKDITEFTNSTTYSVLRQLVVGIKDSCMPDISLDDIESAVLNITRLLHKLSTGAIKKDKFFFEISFIILKLWKRYENVIMKVIDEIKSTFEVQYWQRIIPKKPSNNLEIPRQMCEEADRVVETCGIIFHSPEHRNLMTFARAFSVSRRDFTDQEFINRFKFYCDCIVAQFREEREMYENQLDSHSVETDFDKGAFDKSYGIEGSKSQHFFNKALDKVNHPDFLGNIDELYDKLQRPENVKAQLPFLTTTKSCVHIFCGPLDEEKLELEFYCNKVVELTGFEVNSKNSVMEIINGKDKGSLIVIQPNNLSKEDNQVAELAAIVVQSKFIDNCQMGLILTIYK